MVQTEKAWPCLCGEPVFPWPDPYLPKFGAPLVYEDAAWRAVIRWWHRLRRYHRDPWTNERVPVGEPTNAGLTEPRAFRSVTRPRR